MDANKIFEIEESAEGGDSSFVPDYATLPGMDFSVMPESNENAGSFLNPAEAQLVMDILSHFFLARIEQNPSVCIQEKMENINKTKPQAAATLHKKQFLDITFPPKLKKSLQRIINYCHEGMRSDPSLWLRVPEPKILKKDWPKFMTFNSKRKFDITEENDAQLRQELMNFTQIQELPPLSDASIKPIVHMLTQNEAMDRQTIIEYIWLGGGPIEVSRFKSYFSILGQVQQVMDRAETRRKRCLKDAYLNFNGLAVLYSLIIYFYDQDNAGRILAHDSPLNTDFSNEKISLIVSQLNTYEEIGRMSLICNSLAESPIWFFLSATQYVRILTEEFILSQNLSLSRFFSKDHQARCDSSAELRDFQFADQRAISFLIAVIEFYLPNSRHKDLSELLNSNSDEIKTHLFDKNPPTSLITGLIHPTYGHSFAPSADKKEDKRAVRDQIVIESLMINEAFEYYVLNVVLRIESVNFELNCLEMIDQVLSSCHRIYVDISDYVEKVLSRLGREKPSKNSLLKTYESKLAPYKSEVKDITVENDRLKERYLEHFEYISNSDLPNCFRVDFLCVMYETRLNSTNMRKQRVDRILEKFKRLDESSKRAPETFFYLNAFQLSTSNYSQEIEAIKNEYFLKTASMCLNAVLVLTSHSMKEEAVRMTSCDINIEEAIREEGFCQFKFQTMLDKVTEIYTNIKTLVDLKPAQLEGFLSFGIDQERLFTKENFLQTVFQNCTLDSSKRLSELYQKTDEFTKALQSTQSLLINPSKQSLLVMQLSQFLEDSYEVIRKSLLSLYSIYEKSKSKQKDAHYFLRSAVTLKQYSFLYFKNPRSEVMCNKFKEYLCDEYFLKNIDFNLKYETDLKFNYLFNNPIYKNNLRYEFFSLLSDSELENVRTFKKVERLAFKENNPLYLILAFKSMEYNLRDLFKRVYKASLRELEIILAPNFGTDLEALARLVNDNDDYNVFSSEKKNYDIKSTKSIVAFVKSTAKTELFDLLSSYLYDMYCSISACYSFCLYKKTNLTKSFQENTVKGELGARYVAIMDEPITDPSDYYARLLESLENLQEKANLLQVCRDFRVEYLSDLAKQLYSVLGDSTGASNSLPRAPAGDDMITESLLVSLPSTQLLSKPSNSSTQQPAPSKPNQAKKKATRVASTVEPEANK
jgi:hypothetical protein